MKRIVWVLSVLLTTISSFSAQSNSPSSPQFHWDRQTFTVGGKDVVLIGGSMHYFRIPEPEWVGTFERMKEDGFNIVDTYIPWFIHEPEEGKFNFDSLQRFLDLAHKYGLYVVARPGPYINSETDQGAFPRWLSGKNIGFRRNTEMDRKWSEHWYDAVMPLLARNQITHGGPVVMVQIENEYGHPQYISDQEKKEYVKFLYQTASAYGFDVPLMGNDMQFAQEDPGDPILSKIYGTVDAYFGSFDDLEKMLAKQRKLTANGPLGCAEYGLNGAEATVRTMLGSGAGYLDLYMFRGGSQFSYAAKGYEFAGYSADAIVEEGGFVVPNYRAMKANAMFLRQFGSIVARAGPAAEPATIDDPEVWIRQRNKEDQGFLFVRSDIRGVSARTLALESASQQHITYHDPKSGAVRVVPQYTTMLLRRGQTRLLPLDLPVRGQATLVYSTADLLSKFDYPQRTWLVLYGNPGDESEAAFSFPSKPAGLDPDAVWNQERLEAVVRLQFGERDQVIPLTNDISLLVLSRERAYRAKELSVGGEPALVVSNADDTLIDASGDTATLHLELRAPTDEFSVLAGQKLETANSGLEQLQVRSQSGIQEFEPNIAVPDLDLPDVKVRASAVPTTFQPGISKTLSQLVSLPEAGIWKKGITHYQTTFPARPHPLRLRFFTDDYKAVYVGGQFVPEASNRAEDVVLGSKYCAGRKVCPLDIYYVDTGRPKEDLGLWRLDEKKGLQSAVWVHENSDIPLDTAWHVSFADLTDLSQIHTRKTGLPAIEYSFRRPATGELQAVWRAFMPALPALVYLNGVYVEHHEPGHEPNIGRPGIYLPPSMLKDENTLLFVMLEPRPRNLPSPVIRADGDSMRKSATLVLQFAAKADIP